LTAEPVECQEKRQHNYYNKQNCDWDGKFVIQVCASNGRSDLLKKYLTFE
jgi:hypothetical protein